MKKKKSRKKINKIYKKEKFGTIVIVVILLMTFIYQGVIYRDNTIPKKAETISEKINYDDYFFDNVITIKEKDLYIKDTEFLKVGTVGEEVTLNLIKDENYTNGYFKIKDMDYYIDYQNIIKTESEIIDDHWKNYIPYNESIKTSDKTSLYYNEKLIYNLNEGLEFPIIIKEKDYYGVSFKDNLYYIKKDSGEVIKNTNTEKLHANSISALVYHATYDSNNTEEKRRCISANSVVCLSDIQFDKQMKYLSDNSYYTASMDDVEKFVDGKVQLPKKTVVITIDDGYYIDAAVKVLEKYNLHATLFLIGALADLDEWKTDSFYSKSLELQSHTYLSHTPGKCSGGQGSILKCGNKEELLADLKKSRDQLNGAKVFCWPFFEYNDYAISIIKEAGFTMAFAGGRQKIKVGSDKYKLPRYGIINTTTLDGFISVVK